MASKFLRDGEPFVWATGGALAFTLLMMAILFLVVLTNGLGVFWPSPLAQVELRNGEKVLGEITREETIPATQGKRRRQFKVGNRDLYGADFRWIPHEEIRGPIVYPPEAFVIERREHGVFLGFLRELHLPILVSAEDPLPIRFQNVHREIHQRWKEVRRIESQLAAINEEVDRYHRERLRLAYHGKQPDDVAVQRILAEEKRLNHLFTTLHEKQCALEQDLRRNRAVFADVNGRTKEIALADIVRFYQPNQMTFFQKVAHYLEKVRELLLDPPRESNTEGGLFPAIFGTVMMIFLMSFLSFPLGVLAGIYLREYAKEGTLVRLVRIGVNNLAGIPSIVYGIFGLGFFVYGIGGRIDEIFYPHLLPTPTFGTGGVLWASLTLGILTVPVVIVATEEALGSIPAGIREGSLALGATQFQTLVRVLLPMASPGIMTGFILAMARAAGEVAPLMITGVVKIAPTLPIDSTFPFGLNRKFMHLGFHIYDIGFQCPNAEAARPMVYVTTLLLVLIVLVMSSVAIHLRNRMRKKYQIRAI